VDIKRVIAQFVLFSMFFLFLSMAQADPLFKGNMQKMDDYIGKGQWTVVMLWASYCHVCNQEVHEYQAFHDKYKGKNAQVIGISLDGQIDLAKGEGFIKRHQVKFPNLIDEPEIIATRYFELTGSVWGGTPTFLIYSPKGELLAQQVGAVPVPIIEKFIQDNPSL